MDESRKILEDYYRKNFDRLVKMYTNRADTSWNAEDVIQGAFADALQYLHTYNKDKPFETWFISIVDNRLRDFMRTEKNYGMGMEFKEEQAEAVEEDHDEDISPYIMKHIEASKRPKRDILYLTFVCGYKLREVSKRLQIPYHACHKTLVRFRKKMREELGAA